MAILVRGARCEQRGFALIAALGVMVLLSIMAFGAATTAHFTYGLSKARQLDRQLGEMLREASKLLSVQMVPGAPEAAFPVLNARTLSGRDVQVSGTLVRPEVATTLLSAALQPRDGDHVVELAAAVQGLPGLRSSVYLINARGMRHAPILLLERRQ